MKPIQSDEIMGLAEYEKVRDRFRSRVIAEKKLRRVALGPRVSAVFENRDTVLLQVQEMLRTERITRPAAVQHELDTYNELLPQPGELSCTLMIEIPDRGEREAFLVAARGIEKHVWLVAGTQRVAARSVARPGTVEDRTTAVHYLKFDLPLRLAESLRGAATGHMTMTHLELAIDHPTYAESAVLGAETVLSLGQDLE